MHWINMGHIKDQKRVAITVTNLQVLRNARNFLTSWATTGIWRRIIRHGVWQQWGKPRHHRYSTHNYQNKKQVFNWHSRFFIQTHVLQEGCRDDASFEAPPPTVEPAAGPVLAEAQAPFPVVQYLQGLLWTDTVHLTEMSHRAIPLRHQQFAVKRDVKTRQRRGIIRKD